MLMRFSTWCLQHIFIIIFVYAQRWSLYSGQGKKIITLISMKRLVVTYSNNLCLYIPVVKRALHYEHYVNKVAVMGIHTTLSLPVSHFFVNFSHLWICVSITFLPVHNFCVWHLAFQKHPVRKGSHNTHQKARDRALLTLCVCVCVKERESRLVNRDSWPSKAVNMDLRETVHAIAMWGSSGPTPSFLVGAQF